MKQIITIGLVICMGLLYGQNPNLEVQAPDVNSPAFSMRSASGGDLFSMGVDNTTGDLVLYRNGAFTEPVFCFTDDANARLGIGIMVPQDKLHVVNPGWGGVRIDGDDTGDIRLHITNGGGNHYVFDDDSDGHTFKVESAGALAFNTGGPTEAMRITSARNVDIPNGDLTLGDGTGTIFFNELGVTKAYLWYSGTNLTLENNETGGDVIIDAIDDLYLESGGTTFLKANDNGDLQFGRGAVVRTDITFEHTTGGPTLGDGITIENTGANNNRWNLYVVNNTGDFELSFKESIRGYFSNASGAYTALSDKRMKTNIKAIPSVLNKVAGLVPSLYSFISDNSNQEYIGLIAQDVKPIFPQLVNKKSKEGTSDFVYTFDYSGLAVVAIKAIQEQQEVIDNQKTEIDRLTSIVSELSRRMKIIEAQIQ